MATQDKPRLPGIYNRRIEIQYPTETVNRSNEPQTVYATLYTNYPARKVEVSSGDSEDLKDNKVSTITEVNWELRWIKGLQIKSNWKIIDMADGQIYDIITPPGEIGFRDGIALKTKVVQ